MKQTSLFFWQPRTNLTSLLSRSKEGKLLLIILNYIIWFFFFFISYILVGRDPNIFWQLLFATILAELAERFIKSKVFWRRPLFESGGITPPGLVDSWYKTGSFPSGHTIKTLYFLLFVIQYQVFGPLYFLILTLPLLTFRVMGGFHYPIDMIGGAIIGIVIWILVYQLQMPPALNSLIQNIFNFVFFKNL